MWPRAGQWGAGAAEGGRGTGGDTTTGVRRGGGHDELLDLYGLFDDLSFDDLGGLVGGLVGGGSAAPYGARGTIYAPDDGTRALASSHGGDAASADRGRPQRHRQLQMLQMLRGRDSRRWLRGWLMHEGRVERVLSMLQTATPTVRQALTDVLARLLVDGDDEDGGRGDQVQLEMLEHHDRSVSGGAIVVPSVRRGTQADGDGEAAQIV